MAIQIAVVGGTEADGPAWHRRRGRRRHPGIGRRHSRLWRARRGHGRRLPRRQAAGGLTVGFLPGTDASAANPWVDVMIPTGLGEGRNALVVRSAAAVIAVSGEYGTLSEIALALRAQIPVSGSHLVAHPANGENDTGYRPDRRSRRSARPWLSAWPLHRLDCQPGPHVDRRQTVTPDTRLVVIAPRLVAGRHPIPPVFGVFPGRVGAHPIHPAAFVALSPPSRP